MKPNKRLAAVVAGALAVTGLAAITSAGSAQAVSGTISYYCQITDNVVASAVSTYTNRNAEILVSPASVAEGASQTITVNVGGNGTTASGPSVLNNGPFAASAGAFQAIAVVSVDGGPLTNVWSSTASPATAGNQAVFPNGWTASWTNTFATGAHNVQLDAIIYDSTSSGPTPWAPTGSATNLAAAYSFDAICTGDSADPAGNGGAGPPTGSTAPVIAAGDQLNALTTNFSVLGPQATVATSTGQAAGAQYIARNLFYAETRTVTLTGTLFAANDTTGTVQFCDTTGVTCQTTAAVTNNLATDGTGNLSGSITIPSPATNLTTGARTIKITGLSTNPVLVPVTVLGTPAITLTPAAGGPGTVVTVAGSNFNVGNTDAGSLVYGTTGTAAGAGAVDNTTDPAVPFTTSATGTFSLAYTIGDATTNGIVAAQNTPITGPPTPAQASAFGAFAMSTSQCTAYTGNTNLPSTGCSTAQSVYATVLAGSLSQQAVAAAGNPSATVIVFCKTAAPSTPPGGTQPGNTTACGLSSPTTATPMFANLNPVTVTDTRGSNYGWSLTATLPNLTAGSKSIANTAVSIAPTCVSSNAASAPGHTAGATSAFGSAVTLCTKDTTQANGSTGGVWTVGGALTLTVPAFQAAGQYNSTLTVNLA